MNNPDFSQGPDGNKKMESSKSLNQLCHCGNHRTKPKVNVALPVGPGGGSSTIPHSKTFHETVEPKTSHQPFSFSQIFTYSTKISRRKLLGAGNHIVAAANTSSKASTSSLEDGAQAYKDEKPNVDQTCEAKNCNKEEKLIADADRKSNHKKSLSCFNFNPVLTRPNHPGRENEEGEYENTVRKNSSSNTTTGSISSANKKNISKQVVEKQSSNHTLSDVPSIKLERKSVETEMKKPCNGKHTVLKASQSTNNISRTVTITASTSELLKCLAIYLSIKCRKLANFHGNEVIFWLRSVDRSLLAQGWQDIAFISPANVVFIYLLLRHYVSEKIKTVEELQAIVLTCLYLSYSYVGNEISYPLKPFLIESDRKIFWSRCVAIINESSAKMLLINQDPAYFTHIFTELKQYGDRPKNEQ